MCFVIALSPQVSRDDPVVVRHEIEIKRRVSNGESYKCDGIPMDSLITAAARALAPGDPSVD
jgi:hypothetical protein